MYPPYYFKSRKLRNALHHVDHLYHMIRCPHDALYGVIRCRIAVLLSVHLCLPSRTNALRGFLPFQGYVSRSVEWQLLINPVRNVQESVHGTLLP